MKQIGIYPIIKVDEKGREMYRKYSGGVGAITTYCGNIVTKVRTIGTTVIVTKKREDNTFHYYYCRYEDNVKKDCVYFMLDY